MPPTAQASPPLKIPTASDVNRSSNGTTTNGTNGNSPSYGFVNHPLAGQQQQQQSPSKQPQSYSVGSPDKQTNSARMAGGGA